MTMHHIDSEASFTSTLAQGTEELEDIILSWEPETEAEIRHRLAHHNEDRPFMIGVVGNPGSGKTTSCTALSELLGDIGALVVPFDGYHYTMAELESKSNAADLIYRRGAPDTFDARRLRKDLHRIRDGTDAQMALPGFDHALGDPEPDQHLFVRDHHKIVLCEGLYLLHDDEQWKETKDLFDYTVFVNADVDVCVERLKVRNQCIPGYTAEEIEDRCDRVDRVNAEIVERSKARADIAVDSAAQRTIFTTTVSDGTPEQVAQVSWETEMADRIRRHVQEAAAHSNPQDNQQQHPYMLSLVGGPGCGKTTSCAILSDLLEDVGCFVMPFDGYHYPLSYLEAQPNAQDLVYRRGAPDTFDRDRLYEDLRRIQQGDESTIDVPGFDHAVGDPEEGAHKFDRNKHKVVLCEGLYLLHDQEGWDTLRSVFNHNIFVDSDIDSCVERLKVRNKCIPGYTEEEIEARCEAVDRVNAVTVDRSKRRADRVVQGVASKMASPLEEAIIAEEALHVVS